MRLHKILKLFVFNLGVVNYLNLKFAVIANNSRGRGRRSLWVPWVVGSGF